MPSRKQGINETVVATKKKIKYGREGGAFVGIADPEAIPSIIIDNLQLEGLTNAQMTEARIGLETAIVAARLAGQRAMEEISYTRTMIKNNVELVTQADAHCCGQKFYYGDT